MPENLIAGKGNERYVMHCGLKEQYGACGSLLSLLLTPNTYVDMPVCL